MISAKFTHHLSSVGLTSLVPVFSRYEWLSSPLYKLPLHELSVFRLTSWDTYSQQFLHVTKSYLFDHIRLGAFSNLILALGSHIITSLFPRSASPLNPYPCSHTGLVMDDNSWQCCTDTHRGVRQVFIIIEQNTVTTYEQVPANAV